MSINGLAKPLNPYLTENLESKHSKFSRLSTAYWILNKISLIAIGAIMAAIFAATYGGIVLSGGASLAALAAIISTYPLMQLAASAHNKSRDYGNDAALEARVIAQYKLDLKKGDADIAAFIQGEGAAPPSEIPLSAFRPLIARYKVIQEEAHLLYDQAEKEKVDQDTDRLLRFTKRENGYLKLEKTAIPAAINAAILLQIIQNPTLPYQIVHPNRILSYSKIGLCRPKPPLERIFDRCLAPRDDHYFFFVKSLGRGPLTLQELCDDPSPKAIRRKLFGASVKN